MVLFRWLAKDLDVPPPSASEFAAQLVVAALGLVAMGAGYVLFVAVMG